MQNHFFAPDKVSGEFTGTCLGRSVRLLKALEAYKTVH